MANTLCLMSKDRGGRRGSFGEKVGLRNLDTNAKLYYQKLEQFISANLPTLVCKLHWPLSAVVYFPGGPKWSSLQERVK